MTQIQISKVQLIEQINLWSTGKNSVQQLQDWMVTFYDPTEIAIGSGESDLVIEAMNIIMNEYELAKPNKFKIESAAAALDFLSCNEDGFEKCKYAFIHQGFLD